MYANAGSCATPLRYLNIAACTLRQNENHAHFTEAAQMKTDAPGPFTIAALLFPLFLGISFLGGCNQEKNRTAENTYVVVTGEMQSAADDTATPACTASTAKGSTSDAPCQGKTITLTFHRTNPDIAMLMITTDLPELATRYPGWRASPEALTCSGTSICREQCSLNLTYTPTPDRPESTIYINYEYLVNGEKLPKKNRVSIVYMPSSSTVSSEEIS